MKKVWTDVKGGARYATKSPRVVRYWLKHGLRHSKTSPGGISIKYEWLDEFLESKEVKETKVDEIVNEVFAELKK